MLKFLAFLLTGIILSACASNSELQVVLTTTIAPEVTLQVRNDSAYAITILTSSSVGASFREGDNTVMNHLSFEEVAIEPGGSHTFSWGPMDDAIAIAGHVDFEQNGEKIRLSATF